MDFNFDPDDITVPQVALYSTISFLIVTVIGVFLYITCSKKYKLNWFEKNLLETACENQEFGARFVYLLDYLQKKEHKRSWNWNLCYWSNLISHTFRSQEALLTNNAIPYNVDTVDTTSLRSSNRSPVSSVNETFWVPTINPRHPSTHSEAIATTSTGHKFKFSSGSFCLNVFPLLLLYISL